MNRSGVFRFCACAAVAALQGCGGDGDGGSSGTSATDHGAIVCQDPPEGLAEGKLPAGIFGGTIEGRADPSFILLSFKEPQWGEDRALLFYGPDLAATSSVTGFISIVPSGLYCDSDDLRARNATDQRQGKADKGTVGAYAHLTLDPGVPSVAGTPRYLDRGGASYRLSGTGLPGSDFSVSATPRLADVFGDWSLDVRMDRRVKLQRAASHRQALRYRAPVAD